MTFQQNARATFYWRNIGKKASLIALAVTFGTSFAVVSVPNQSLALAYVFLLNMVVLVGVVHWQTTGVNILGGRKWFSVGELWRPILFGLVTIFASIIVLLLWFGWPLQSHSVQQNFRDVLLQAAFIGFVEEYMRWTWIQTLPYGLIAANLLWVLLHPEVAPILSGQVWSPFFATVSLTFGFTATFFMWEYETPLRGGFNKYLGPVYAATLHAGFNALTIIWAVQVNVPGAGMQVFGPMAAPAVVVLGCIYFGVSAGGRAVICGRSWLRLRGAPRQPGGRG